MTDHDPLSQHIRRQMDAQTIDSDTRRQLRLARDRALDAAGRPRPLDNPLLRTGLAFAGVAALALLLMLGLNRNPSQPRIDSLDAFEIATSGQPLEFYEEDLEFYLWLEQQDLG